MFSPEDVQMKDDDSSYSRRGIPAVPTPDWNNENFTKNMGHSTNACGKMDEAHTASDRTMNMDLKNAPNTNSHDNSSVTSSQTPQIGVSRMEVGSATSSATRISGDVTFTPTHTPVLNVNPHSTMVAATPAASSGVNQAKNSIKLQNCVSTVNLGCELKLLDIYCRTRYSEYNPQRFQGVVMKILDPKATALVFRSGKIVCTGARNENDSYLAARKFARIIQKLGSPVKFLDFKVQNFCATADLRFPIRLEALQQSHGQFASYEPELFPGLIYRMVRPRVVLLIFVNGKIVFTGGKTRNEITEALEIIYPILRNYKVS